MNDKKKPKARVEYTSGTSGAKATINLADSVDWKQLEPSPGTTLIIEGGQTKVDLTAPSSLNPNLYQGIGSLIPQTTLSTTLAGSLEVKKAYPQEKIDPGKNNYRCLYCKISTLEINGLLEKHKPNCKYRLSMESMQV